MLKICTKNQVKKNHEDQPLTENEINAVKRGGIYVKGYRAANANIEREESLSSVDSKKVHFKDHKVFKKAGPDGEPANTEEWLVNPVTGEMESKQAIQQRLAAPSSRVRNDNATTYPTTQ